MENFSLIPFSQHLYTELINKINLHFTSKIKQNKRFSPEIVLSMTTAYY